MPPKANTTTVLLTTPEVARALRIADRTVRRWVDAGRMRPEKRAGGAYVFSAEEVARVAALQRPRRGRPRRGQKSGTHPLGIA